MGRSSLQERVNTRLYCSTGSAVAVKRPQLCKRYDSNCFSQTYQVKSTGYQSRRQRTGQKSIIRKTKIYFSFLFNPLI